MMAGYLLLTLNPLSMLNLHPYLSFDGDCRKAMTFYQKCLGGELAIQTVGESPVADQQPTETHPNIMHASITKHGVVLLFASDMMMHGKLKKGNSVTLTLNGAYADKGEIESAFRKLSAGGKVTRPLKEEFFGTYGDLVDKFGVRWMFQIDPKVTKG